MFVPNEIKPDENERTTEEIKKLLSEVRKILFIVEDKDVRYAEGEEQVHTQSYYEFLKHGFASTLIVDFSKFFYLVLQGYLRKGMFEMVIIRARCLRKEFIVIFRYFYFNHNDLKPRVVAYLETIREIDSIIMQSFRPLKSLKSNIRMVVLHPIHTPEVDEYVELSSIVHAYLNLQPETLQKIGNMEKCSFVETARYIRMKMSLNDLSICPRDTDPGRKEDLLIREYKYRYLQKLSSEPVFLVTKNKAMFQMLDKDKVLDVEAMDISLVEKSSMGSLLVFYEECGAGENMELFRFPFKEIVFLRGENEPHSEFTRILLLQNEAEHRDVNLHMDKHFAKLGNNTKDRLSGKLDAFVEHSSRLPKEYRIGGDGAVACDVFSFQLLTHFMYLVEKIFEDNLLFLRNVKITKRYITTGGRKFICMIKLPSIHEGRAFNIEHGGEVSSNKKAALAHAAKVVLKRLYEARYCDKYLFPNEKEFTENNKTFHLFLSKAYATSDTSSANLERIRKEFLKSYSGEEALYLHEFVRRYRLCIDNPDGVMRRIEAVYRGQPTCMKKYPETYYCYTFNGRENGIGILTGPSFREPAMFRGISVDFVRELGFTKAEMDMILFYQIAFFSINFKKINPSVENSRRYCYLVVPMKDRDIDFGFLGEMSKCFIRSSVYETKDLSILRENIIFDPFFHVYYGYHGPSTMSLHSNDLSGRSYLECFEKKYNVKLIHRTNDPGLMFEGCSVSKRGFSKTPTILSSEILRVTYVNRSIVEYYRSFVEYFYVFESIALAYEFKQSLNLKISLDGICTAFSKKGECTGENHVDYDRVEFVGDSVLKYVISKHLFLSSKGVGAITAIKNELISNSNLYDIASKICLRRYFSIQGFSENLFQPPDITLMGSAFLNTNAKHMECFNCRGIFKNNNQHVFAINTLAKRSEEEIYNAGKKTYADVVEALIGVHFIELGLDSTNTFLRGIGLLNDDPVMKPYAYDGVLQPSDIRRIEGVIGYKFQEVGWLEKAAIHPSFSNNIFGAHRFQRLEFLGDCTLDILVTKYIYFKHPHMASSGLHDMRKSLVNNNTFSRVLFKTELASLCKTLFGSDEINEIGNNMDESGGANKVFGDIFEAIVGAVAADCGFNLHMLEGFFSTILAHLIECRMEC